MKKVVININELGPVKEQVIELKPVMLFTGESGLGKSYVNFLAYYLFYVFSSERMYDFLLEKIGTDINDKKEFSFSLNTGELIDWLHNDVKKFFVYLYNYDNIKCDVEFLFEKIEEEFKIKYTKNDVKNGDKDFLSFLIDFNGKKTRTFFAYQQRMDRAVCDVVIRQLCFRFLGVDVVRSFLLPPGRASLLTGDFTAQSGSSKLGLYDLFLRDNDRITSMAMWNRMVNRDNTRFVQQVHDLIKGDLVAEKDGLFLKTEDNQLIPLGAAASSIKELTPLLQLVLSGRISDYSVCIEEPEAHLHPEMQISIADLLAACINQYVYMQITTHSDYFLQRVNQLLKYGSIRVKNPQRYQIICDENNHNKECYLDKKDVNAYYFSSEKGKTKIEPLTIGDEGIPLSTFFNAVGVLSREDEFLKEELEKLSGENV